MLKIDCAILNTNKNICKNIDCFDESERGLLSQNILAQLRNFVEYIAVKVYANGSDIDPNDYNKNVAALKHLQTHGNLRFLNKFHGCSGPLALGMMAFGIGSCTAAPRCTIILAEFTIHNC